MVKPIRPYRLFEKLTECYTAQVPIPKHHGVGISLLETFCLISAMRTVKAKTVLEIGTFRGVTALTLAMNLPTGGHLWTVDLPPGAELPEGELDRAAAASRPETPIFLGTEWEPRITRVLADSRTWEPHLDFDFVFIDGEHDAKTVKSDTNLAFDSLPEAVFWHDYSNPQHPEVTLFLDRLHSELFHVGSELFHVGDTHLAGWFRQ